MSGEPQTEPAEGSEPSFWQAIEMLIARVYRLSMTELTVGEECTPPALHERLVVVEESLSWILTYLAFLYESMHVRGIAVGPTPAQLFRLAPPFDGAANLQRVLKAMKGLKRSEQEVALESLLSRAESELSNAFNDNANPGCSVDDATSSPQRQPGPESSGPGTTTPRDVAPPTACGNGAERVSSAASTSASFRSAKPAPGHGARLTIEPASVSTTLAVPSCDTSSSRDGGSCVSTQFSDEAPLRAENHTRLDGATVLTETGGGQSASGGELPLEPTVAPTIERNRRGDSTLGSEVVVTEQAENFATTPARCVDSAWPKPALIRLRAEQCASAHAPARCEPQVCDPLTLPEPVAVDSGVGETSVATSSSLGSSTGSVTPTVSTPLPADAKEASVVQVKLKADGVTSAAAMSASLEEPETSNDVGSSSDLRVSVHPSPGPQVRRLGITGLAVATANPGPGHDHGVADDSRTVEDPGLSTGADINALGNGDVEGPEEGVGTPTPSSTDAVQKTARRRRRTRRSTKKRDWQESA